MTDENHDIEQVEVNKSKETPSNLGITVKIILNCSLFAFIFVVISFIGVVSKTECHLTEQAPESVAQSLLYSLQSSAAIYVAQQAEKPNVFSDFVIPKGSATGQYTFTLDNIDATPEFINTQKMKFSFERDNTAIYYLNGAVVTASFNFENEKRYYQEKKAKEIVQEREETIIFYIIVIVLTTIIFLFFYPIYEKFLLKLILIIVLCIIVLPLCVPRFSKPAIYLYPEKPTEVNITLDNKIDITLDVPKYAPGEGWHVMAYPDSIIVDLQPQYTNCNDLNPKTFGLEYVKEACLNNNYPYIYWEGGPANKILPPQTKGWLVKTTNVKAFLTTKLDEIGFNKTEKDEFIRYWVHKIKESRKESVFISFMQTDIIDEYLPMTVKPTPDNINRFYIIVDLNVNNHKTPQAQKLNRFKRDGFTLVDWGGAMIGLNLKP